jgi:5-methylcytosine-specific restriction enzyme B
VADRELKTGWDEFLYWAARLISQPNFEADERTYKMRAVAPLAEAVSSLSDGAWQEPLCRGLQNQDNNVVDWRASQRFRDWAISDEQSAQAAMSALWSSDNTHGSERIDAFNAFVPPEVLSRPGVLCNLAAYLLGAMDPIRWPNFKVTALDLAYELTRFPNISRKSSPGEHYGHALLFFDTMIEEAQTRSVPVRDRLDAQGVMWVIAGSGKNGSYDFSTEEWSELDAFVQVPVAIRKEQSQKATPAPLQRRRPTTGLCPRCVNDDEVRFVGPEDDGWQFECAGGRSHAEPYRFHIS